MTTISTGGASNARTRAKEKRAGTVEGICKRIAVGENLAAICRGKGTPGLRTFWTWLSEDRALVERYELALTMRAQIFAEELVAIADDRSRDVIQTDDGPTFDLDHIMRTKLRVNTRQWVMSRLLQRRYGDRVVQEITGADGGPVQTVSLNENMLARLEAIRAKMIGE